MRRLKWFALGAITYVASILTHEVFALIPPVFVSLFVLSKNQTEHCGMVQFWRMSLYKPAIWWLAVFGVILRTIWALAGPDSPHVWSLWIPNSDIVSSR